MFVSFVVVGTHELAKGLAGGRVRVLSGGDPVEAVRRRIAQDTRCDVVEIRRIGADDDAGKGGHYDLTLRGCLQRPGDARGTLHEGTIRVAVGVVGVPRERLASTLARPARRSWGEPLT